MNEGVPWSVKTVAFLAWLGGMAAVGVTLLLDLLSRRRR